MRTLAILLMNVAALLADDSLLKQGQAALDRDDPRSAIKLLEKAVSDSPRDAEAHYLLGVAYGKRAEQPDVIDHATLARRTCREFEKAVSLDPNHLDARMALVQYYTLAPGVMGGSIPRAQKRREDGELRDEPLRGANVWPQPTDINDPARVGGPGSINKKPGHPAVAELPTGGVEKLGEAVAREQERVAGGQRNRGEQRSRKSLGLD